MSTQYYFPPFNDNVSWKKFDVIYDGAYRYATQDMPISSRVAAPTLRVNYAVTSCKREDDVVTVFFAQTGNVPDFVVGSMISVYGIGNPPDPTMSHTGMVMDGGSGWASYINPGWPAGIAGSAGNVDAVNPGWTSGHLFIPTYSSRIDTQNKAIVTQLGDGYVQRSPMSVNSFGQTMNLVYQNRSSREARAFINFFEDTQGSRSFPIMIPDSHLTNQPNHKYYTLDMQTTPVGYNLYDISETVIRCFEP